MMQAARALLVILLFLSGTSFGQAPTLRLSDWLLAQPKDSDAFPLGLSLRVPEETIAQVQLRMRLLRSLSQSDDSAASARLGEWIASLPVTGRVAIAVADPRWLQGNPARDHIVRPEDTVILPRRPSIVAVVTVQGDICRVPHTPGREIMAYVDACMPQSAKQIDWAWIAQPDGRMQRYGLASWNRQSQDEPAPGAWIWAPPRTAKWTIPVSELLVQFLATQGPAPESGGSSPTQHFRKPESDSATSPRSRDAEVTANDWGSIGLLQTPSARMAKTGAFSFTFSRTTPYSRGNTFFQPFDWMEAGFRYTDISNRLYGPPELSGSQTDKDKSIDVKFRLFSESAYVPAVSVGLRDIAGTGKFSGEYLVANKQTADFDWSIGLGWGNVGGRGDMRNPLSSLSKSFDIRKGATIEGGNLGFGNYFRGRAAMFGGVQYHTPWKSLILKLEYEGNNYQNEGNNQRQSSPWNAGLVYRASRSVDLSIGIERGNTVMFGFTFHTQLDGMETPKPYDPPRIPIVQMRPGNTPDWAATSRDIAAQADMRVRSIEQHGNELRVTIDDAEAVYLRNRQDRVASVLHRDAPASVDRFSLAYRQRGLDMAESVIDRDAWVDSQTRAQSRSDKRESMILRGPSRPILGDKPVGTVWASRPPRFEAELGFDYQQTLGGPDGFVLFQISAAERVKLRLRDDTWLQGTLRLGLVDNYDKFKYTAPSNLPRVRTFMREYLTTSTVTLPNLQATHVGKLSENNFYSVYAGYLESMFAGVGAEWLYKPSASRVAVGVDVNAVRQRKFEQDFGLLDYRVATGHATVYWDTGWQDVQAKVSVGRYLAGDFGATLDLSRVFRNGVSIGAFATKTNVSAAQFGEGSFDKGIYMSIPFDALLTRSTNTIGNFVWKPLTRDGGAMLARSTPLVGLTYVRNERTMWFEPAQRHNDDVIPADRREEWTPKSIGPEPFLQVAPRPAVSQFAPGSGHEHRLVQELFRQGFRNINVTFDASNRLNVVASNDTLRPLSRAAGRAARTALRLSPLDTREIRITLAERVDPVVTYEFVDLPRLERYFGGNLAAKDLASTVVVTYIDRALREEDPISLLSDLDTMELSPKLSEIVPGYRSARRVGGDLAAAGSTATDTNWLRAGALGTGLVLASSLLDKRAFKFSQDHANSRWIKGFNTVGNAMPYIGAGLVTIAALDGSDPRRSNTAVASLESAGVAFAVATGLKYAVGRARPEAGLGARSFKPGSSQDSFPSRHAILSWAVATPMALEYDSYWRYGAAAVASLARVTKREHWMSDVVAGSLLGYGIGRIMWETSQVQNKGAPRALVTPSSVDFAWSFD